VTDDDGEGIPLGADVNDLDGAELELAPFFVNEHRKSVTGLITGSAFVRLFGIDSGHKSGRVYGLSSAGIPASVTCETCRKRIGLIVRDDVRVDMDVMDWSGGKKSRDSMRFYCADCVKGETVPCRGCGERMQAGRGDFCTAICRALDESGGKR